MGTFNKELTCVFENISNIPCHRYDIVQMVVDELRGISLSEEGGTDVVEDSAELRSGSTHVGESYAEVQHLIKDLVHHLKHLRELQQNDFDFFHKRRQQRWLEDEGDEISCDFNVNKVTTFSGLAVMENFRIPQSLYSAANICRGMEPRCPSEALHLLNVKEDETTTSDKLATFVTISLSVDPFSKDGSRWLQLARDTISRLQEDSRILGGVEVFLGGPAAEYHDWKQELAEKDHSQLAIVAVFALLAFAVCFGSFLASLKLLATIFTALAISFGVNVFIYTDGALDWTGIPALSSSGHIEASVAVPTVYLLATVSMLINEIAAQRGTNKKSLEASSKLACLGIFAWSCLLQSGPRLVEWPGAFVVAIAVDMIWIQNIMVPVIGSKFSFGRTQASLVGVGVRLSDDYEDKQHKAYLAKFDRFLMSPQAP